VELVPAQLDARHRLLAHAHDVQAARIGGRPAAAGRRRVIEQPPLGTQLVAGPRGGVEQVDAVAELRVGQQLVQRRQRAEHDPGEILRVVAQVERRKLAHRRVHRPERQHRCERAEIGRAQLHDPRDAPRVRRQRHSRHHASQAVADQQHLALALGGDAGIQLVREVLDAAPPVVGVEACVESRDLQRQLQLECIEQHHAERHEPGAARQREPRQVARGDFDQVEPDHVVEQRAARADPRAHQAGQHVGHRSCAPHLLGATGQRTQFAIAGLAEQRDQLAAPFAAREQLLDGLVVQAMRRWRRWHGGRQRASLRVAVSARDGSVPMVGVIVGRGR
jgi:hypothetical protein